MVKMKSGLGDFDIKEAKAVAYVINHLFVNEEVTFTADLFSSENLLETVLEALEILGYYVSFSTGKYRWFTNEKANRELRMVYEKDVVIITRREKELLK